MILGLAAAAVGTVLWLNQREPAPGTPPNRVALYTRHWYDTKTGGKQ